MEEDSSAQFLPLARKGDPWRYPGLLFLPGKVRGAAAVLTAFCAEIAEIPFHVREPAAGEIRLQWWRDAVSGRRPDEAGADPLASALLDIVGAHGLPVEGFQRLLEARRFDLYHDPMPDRQALEAYLGETESFLFLTIALCLKPNSGAEIADACGHCGVALGMAKILRELPWRRARKQVHFPADMLRAAGLTSEDWLDDPTPAHEKAVADYCDLLEHHLRRARTALADCEHDVQTVLLPLAAANKGLKAARRQGVRMLERPLEIGPFSLQLAYWRAAVLGFGLPRIG